MKKELQLAEEAIDRNEFDVAADHCNTALESDENSYDARILAGRVAHYQKNLLEAETQYRHALASHPGGMSALEGVASVQISSNNLQGGAETYSQLIKLAQSKSDVAKQREFLWRLAEAQDRLGELEKAEGTLKQLLDLHMDSADQSIEALCFLADLQSKLESSRQSERVSTYLTQQEKPNALRRTHSIVRLQVDAERSDEQLGEEGSLAHTLQEIVSRTIPSPRFARFFEQHLQIYLSRMGNYPPRSAARQTMRMAAMKECAKMVTTSAGGCTTPFPFEAAIWLLEEQEELFGFTHPVHLQIEDKFRPESHAARETASQQTRLKWFRGNSIHRMSIDKLNIRTMKLEPTIGENDDDNRPVATRHESFGVKLAHQFPWLGSSNVAVGLALRRRFLSDPDAPSTAIRRKQIIGALRRGVQMGADSAAGWKALAELQYQTRQWQNAYTTSCTGLEWSVKRRHAGHETLTAFALSLRLCAARCLRRLNRLEEAEAAFKVLAGWTTDGECGFDELSGSAPTSVRQQAMRGIAKIALQRGERQMAKAQYERILGKALMGRGQPAEHWAHAEYAWLQFEDNDLMTAKQHMEKALEEAQKDGCNVTDEEIAEHHYKLGRILWEMGGKYRKDPTQARRHLEAASLEESDFQVSACAYLGHYYHQVAKDLSKAKNCYEETLLLDPQDSSIAEALTQVNDELGLADQAAETAHLASLGKPLKSTKSTSAFAAHSQKAFAVLSPEGKKKVDKIVSDLAERVSSGRLPIQTAHSTNSELGAYSVVSRKPNTRPH